MDSEDEKEDPFDDDLDDDDFKPEPIELESDDDFKDDLENDEDELEPVKIEPRKKRQTPPAKEAEEPVKTIQKSPKKSPKKVPKKPVVYELKPGQSLEDILQTIPDAHLPDLVSTEGMSYRDFKANQSSLQPTGSREIPEGSPNCLGGLTMVFTGVLPTLERTQLELLLQRYGARVTKSISGKTSVVVIGEEAGPSKVAKIRKLKIKAIDEDGFIALISAMPADGGGGVDAQKLKLKREEEEQLALQQAEDEMKLEESRRLQKLQSSSQQTVKVDKISDRPDSDKLWTVKYAPTSINQICGNKGQVAKLTRWLESWYDNYLDGFQHGGSDGSGIFRAVLIHGPPGIGKTTLAHLIAKSLGFDILERNASDIRSKNLLNSEVKSVLNNTSLVGYFHSQDSANDDSESQRSNNKKFVLIMDEVDGMSSGDRGGVGALSSFCRTTSIPMILICNDKSLPKMRPFDRVTFDMPFRRPTLQEMKSRLMTIALREKIKLDPNVIGQLVETTRNDIRQIINLLSTVSTTSEKIGFDESKKISESWKKHVILKPFDIVPRLLGVGNQSLNEKLELFFNDIDFTPLMIQENYIGTRISKSDGTNLSNLELLMKLSDSISESDLVNQKIRSAEQQWSLLPFYGVMSSVLPSSYVSGGLTQRTNFASWLGQNSKKMKFVRYLQQLNYHSSLKTSTDYSQLRLNYIPVLIRRLFNPLKQGADGIEDVLKLMDEYYLTKEDWDILMEFGIGSYDMTAQLKKIPTLTKTQFTKKYNSYQHPVAIYKTGVSVGKKGAAASLVKPDFEDVVDDDVDVPDQEEEVEDEDDIKKDKLIKSVKPKKKKLKK